MARFASPVEPAFAPGFVFMAAAWAASTRTPSVLRLAPLGSLTTARGEEPIGGPQVLKCGGNEWALAGSGQPHQLFFDPQEKSVLPVFCAQASTRRRGVLLSVPLRRIVAEFRGGRMFARTQRRSLAWGPADGPQYCLRQRVNNPDADRPEGAWHAARPAAY